jgi:hypothetical protein
MDTVVGVTVPTVVLNFTDPLYVVRGLEPRLPTAFTVRENASPSPIDPGTVNWNAARVSGWGWGSGSVPPPPSPQDERRIRPIAAVHAEPKRARFLMVRSPVSRSEMAAEGGC